MYFDKAIIKLTVKKNQLLSFYSGKKKDKSVTCYLNDTPICWTL